MKSKSKRKPEEITKIMRGLRENAKEAGLSLRLAAYASYDEQRDEWIVGANYEDGMPSLVLRGGEWFYRDPHTGSDSPCKGGFAEALSNTRCWFTG